MKTKLEKYGYTEYKNERENTQGVESRAFYKSIETDVVCKLNKKLSFRTSIYFLLEDC